MAGHPSYHTQDGYNDHFEAEAQHPQQREGSPRRRPPTGRGGGRRSRTTRAPDHTAAAPRLHTAEPSPGRFANPTGLGPYAVGRNPTTADGYFEYVQDLTDNPLTVGGYPLCNFCGHKSHPRSLCGHMKRMRTQNSRTTFHPALRTNIQTVLAAAATHQPTANFHFQYGQNGGRANRGRGGGHHGGAHLGSPGPPRIPNATAGEASGHSDYNPGQQGQVPQPQSYDPRGMWMTRPHERQGQRTEMPSIQSMVANNQRLLEEATRDERHQERAARERERIQEQAAGAAARSAAAAYADPQPTHAAGEDFFTCSICYLPFASATAYALHVHRQHGAVWL